MKPITAFYEGRYRELGRTKVQEVIDKRKLRVMVILMRQLLQRIHTQGVSGVYLSGRHRPDRHLWYRSLPDREGIDFEHYELRSGWAPSDVDRPSYLRGLDLNVDISMLPDDTIAQLVPGGKLDRMIRGQIKDAERNRDADALKELDLGVN